MNLRLLPLLAISAGALLALKLLGFAFNEDPGVSPIREAVAQETPAPAAGDQMAPEEPATDAPPAAAAPPPLPDNLEIGGSAAERAVLESLGQRRQNLQQQEGQLDLREKLLQATEERIEKRVEELKQLEQRIESAVEEKRQQEDNEIAALVTMYENMKPKDAARIFNSLNLPVLMKIVRQMKPRKMADILGRMSPEAAERLTVAIAGNASTPMAPAPASAPATTQTISPADLPKIPSN
ncbi:flagellar motility protein MotE (MotC chaperone) [Roseibium hamelinense]|uniref:Flagellar motility protein MotE (MotC chaperone) n=1 Tax=Roseibium hamelinense TaxID=150831 RepID=A0A562T9S2_9HYPH|nr:hypothetical protein [Roseibium hamelinense]MTI45247.1 hypothetical protein [Roseibium hamelinense]TWI90389.1 flagellar motility protein MotE (MotC chaperone) [Roseibium hamelinense]